MKTTPDINRLACRLFINTSWACTLMLTIAPLSHASAKGKPLSSAAIEVTLDAVNAWDASANGVTTDGGSSVTDGIDGTNAIVGSSFDIIVDLQSGSRGFEIDLSAPVVDSTYVQTPSVACGSNDLGDSYWLDLTNGSWSFSNAKFRVQGRDYLKLAVGSVSPVNADMEFYDANGNRWQLRWGPYEHSGSGITYNPGSDAVTATRVNANTWTFTTTGDHYAALYRYGSLPRQIRNSITDNFRFQSAGRQWRCRIKPCRVPRFR